MRWTYLPWDPGPLRYRPLLSVPAGMTGQAEGTGQRAGRLRCRGRAETGRSWFSLSWGQCAFPGIASDSFRHAANPDNQRKRRDVDLGHENDHDGQNAVNSISSRVYYASTGPDSISSKKTVRFLR